jgi:hypothetical protein
MRAHLHWQPVQTEMLPLVVREEEGPREGWRGPSTGQAHSPGGQQSKGELDAGPPIHTTSSFLSCQPQLLPH